MTLTRARANGGSRVLYHIGPRPPHPVPYARGKRGWVRASRPELSPDEWVVFLTDTVDLVLSHHGRVGNLYAYLVPEWVIADAGGIQMYDGARELILTRKHWPHVRFLGKTAAVTSSLRKKSRRSTVGRKLASVPQLKQFIHPKDRWVRTGPGVDGKKRWERANRELWRSIQQKLSIRQPLPRLFGAPAPEGWADAYLWDLQFAMSNYLLSEHLPEVWRAFPSLRGRKPQADELLRLLWFSSPSKRPPPAV